MTQEGFKPSVRAPGNPLQRFTGVMGQYKSVPVTFGTRQTIIMEFPFTDVEVEKSKEPYLFPITTIAVKYTPPSDRGKPGQGNRWEVFAASLRRLMGAENADIDNLVGKQQKWELLPGILRLPLTNEDGEDIYMEDADGNPILGNDGKPRQEWGDVEEECWHVVALEGVGSVEEVDVAFRAYLLDLAEGKDEKGFYDACYSDERVTDKPATVQEITDRTLLQPLLDAKWLVRGADGILHKGEGSG